jgi:hypothetical protein
MSDIDYWRKRNGLEGVVRLSICGCLAKQFITIEMPFGRPVPATSVTNRIIFFAGLCGRLAALIQHAVHVKGTLANTFSGVEGTFSIKADPRDVLQFIILGMKDQKAVVVNDMWFNITMPIQVRHLSSIRKSDGNYPLIP